jgi:septal ring-binding cell division protein DamX
MGRNARNGRTKHKRSPASGRLGGVAAAIAVVGAAVFALGLELGARREAGPAVAPDDRLSLLDAADRIAPPAPEPESLVFHDALTKDLPPDTLPALPSKPVARPAAAKAPGPAPPSPAGAKPVATRSGPTPRIENSTWTAGVGVSPEGRWTIQLGASPNEREAQRIAVRHPGARIVTADVDGKRWYRVRLAGFRTQRDAEAELARLSREEGVRGFVVAAR